MKGIQPQRDPLYSATCPSSFFEIRPVASVSRPIMSKLYKMAVEAEKNSLLTLARRTSRSMIEERHRTTGWNCSIEQPSHLSFYRGHEFRQPSILRRFLKERLLYLSVKEKDMQPGKRARRRNRIHWIGHMGKITLLRRGQNRNRSALLHKIAGQPIEILLEASLLVHSRFQKNNLFHGFSWGRWILTLPSRSALTSSSKGLSFVI